LLELVDTHAHVDEVENLDSALDEAKKAGVVAIIAVGSNHGSNQKVLRIADRHASIIHPALGLHPWELGNMDQNSINVTLDFIEEQAPRISAIGEIGLDYDKRVLKVASKERQQDTLKTILALARQYAKPVSIHSRYAWKDTFDIVKEAGIGKAVFHWFTGFSSVLKDILEAGYFISATPAAEYHEEHRRAVRETPLDKLLLETDCPVTYGRENKYRSQPADVLRSLKSAAVLKGTDEDSLARKTTSSAVKFFGLRTQ
jgi:TatD DNase family protein